MAWGISRKLQARQGMPFSPHIQSGILQSRAMQLLLSHPFGSSWASSRAPGQYNEYHFNLYRVSGTIISFAILKQSSALLPIHIPCHFPFSHASTISDFTTRDKKTEGTWGMWTILFQFSHTHTFPFLMWKAAWCQPLTWVPFLPAGHPEDCFYLRVVGVEGNQSKLSVFSASFMGCPQLLI